MSTNIQLRVAGALEAALASRAGDTPLSTTVRRDIERLYALYALELARLRFAADEATLIVAALVWANVDDYAVQHGQDAGALVVRLRAMSPTQAMAVADAAERYWHASGDHLDRLRAVGLVR